MFVSHTGVHKWIHLCCITLLAKPTLWVCILAAKQKKKANKQTKQNNSCKAAKTKQKQKQEHTHKKKTQTNKKSIFAK